MGRFRTHSLEEKKERSKRRRRKKKNAKKQMNKVVQTAISDTIGNRQNPVEPLGEQQSPSVIEQLPVNRVDKKEEAKHSNTLDNERYKKHATVFYCKWKKSERDNILRLKESDLSNTNNCVGQGSFGKCFQAKYGQMDVVVKKVASRGAAVPEAIEEARILNRLRHPNLPIFVGLIQKTQEVWIVTRFCSFNGESITLGQAVKQKVLGDDIKVYVCSLTQIARAIEYLHCSVNILHNDIKISNIVIERENQGSIHTTLIDFGKARDTCSAKVYVKGADISKYKHLAPELGRSGGQQSRSSDIYSFGRVIRYVCFNLEADTLKHIYRVCTRSEREMRPGILNVLKSLVSVCEAQEENFKQHA